MVEHPDFLGHLNKSNKNKVVITDARQQAPLVQQIQSTNDRLIKSITGSNDGIVSDNTTGGRTTLSKLFVPLQLTVNGNNGSTNLQVEEVSNGIAASMSNNEIDSAKNEEEKESKDVDTGDESKNDKKKPPHPTPPSPMTKEEYKVQLKTATASLQKLEAACDKQSKTSEKCRHERDELKEEWDGLIEENKKLKLNLAERDHELSCQLQTSKSNVTVLAHEKEAMEKEMNVARQENKSLQSESDQKSITIASLQQQLQQKTTESDQKSTTIKLL